MSKHFEMETCSRCHGSGQYSYCERYGTTCFKCHGNKTVLSEGKYLGALSAYFETTIPDRGSYGKKHRERLVQFVNDNFPAVIEVVG